jgi:hypothetical protein
MKIGAHVSRDVMTYVIAIIVNALCIWNPRRQPCLYLYLASASASFFLKLSLSKVHRNAITAFSWSRYVVCLICGYLSIPACGLLSSRLNSSVLS